MLSYENSIYMITERAETWVKLSKMGLKDHQARIVTSACPYRRDRKSVIVEYHSTHTY